MQWQRHHCIPYQQLSALSGTPDRGTHAAVVHHERIPGSCGGGSSCTLTHEAATACVQRNWHHRRNKTKMLRGLGSFGHSAACHAACVCVYVCVCLCEVRRADWRWVLLPAATGRTSGTCASRCQPLQHPLAIAVATVIHLWPRETQAICHARRPCLPELHGMRHDDVPASQRASPRQ